MYYWVQVTWLGIWFRDTQAKWRKKKEHGRNRKEALVLSIGVVFKPTQVFNSGDMTRTIYPASARCKASILTSGPSRFIFKKGEYTWRILCGSTFLFAKLKPIILSRTLNLKINNIFLRVYLGVLKVSYSIESMWLGQWSLWSLTIGQFENSAPPQRFLDPDQWLRLYCRLG